jgi:tetratricopeptide (TPR) repeat protein
VDVIVGFRGEGRVLVDGTPLRKHGGELSYGPQTSATRVAGRAGPHRIELRLATYGGHPELTLMVVPATTPVQAPSTLAETLADAYLANQLGDVTRAEAAGQRLEAMPTFAVGLAFAAALVRDDPSLPAGFSRDRARALLRRAVAVDPTFARARNALGGLALDDDRPRETLDEALLAVKAAPGWWLPWLTLDVAYGLRGLTWDADRALDQALARAPRACAVVEAALARAETRRDAASVRRFTDDTVVCGVVTDERISRLRRRGDWGEAEKLLRLGMTLEPDPEGMRRDLGRLLLARGRAKEAVALLEPALERTDGEATVAWADAAIAAGERARARARVASLLMDRPDVPQLVRAARTLGVPLPLDDYRLDGRAVIRAFEASGRRYAAPAVVILDRSVTRLFPSGAAMTLTHEIVRVQSKDAIQKWGEVALPEGAEILTLRTHKVDGTTREPEEVAGKDAISAADLAIGDYLEKETLELSGPHEAFAPTRAGARPGYLGDRFYFQSFDAPLDRSEYLLVTDPETADTLHVDARAGAPTPVRAPAPHAGASEVVTTFAVTEAPQLFGERSAVPAIEHVPSVRVSVAATWQGWGRFLREQMYGASRDAAILERAVTEIRAQAVDSSPRQLAAALLAWVGQNVEADDDLRGAATLAVASGRGNRVATLIALAHRLGLSARLALGRSRFIAEGEAPTPIEEGDDFAEVLVRFDLPGGAVVYVDPRLKHQLFGYLSPGLDGARVLVLETGAFETIRSERGDSRDVDLTVHLAENGQATGEVVETLHGWPALEWAEILDRVGSDQTKLRQDFEQRGLGVHFPGVALKDVRVEISGTDGGQRDRREKTPTGGQAESPIRPVTAAEVRVHYTFTSPRFASRDGDRLRILPTFFRSQPGRRYATEPQRSTALMTNFEVPTKVVARFLLPASARPGGTPGGARVIARAGAYRFREERGFETPPGGTPTVTLRREAQLSVMRVPPRIYPEVAAELRAVDKLEGEEIVIVLHRRVSERAP